MTIKVSGVTEDDNPDDPIVWRRDKSVPGPDGISFRSVVMRKSDESRLLQAFGREWLDAHLRELEADMEKWGVH